MVMHDVGVLQLGQAQMFASSAQARPAMPPRSASEPLPRQEHRSDRPTAQLRLQPVIAYSFTHRRQPGGGATGSSN
ncbi:MAG: hypothetical protein U0736_26695 [Gemmataceae bacterium]